MKTKGSLNCSDAVCALAVSSSRAYLTCRVSSPSLFILVTLPSASISIAAISRPSAAHGTEINRSF